LTLAKHATVSIAELLDGETANDGETVTLAGLITSVQHRTARNSGKQYGIVQLEDFGGEISVMFLGKTYQEFSPALTSDAIAVIKGRVSQRDDGLNIHAASMFLPETGQSLGSGPLMISLPEQRATTEVVTALYDVLIRHSGENEVRMRLVRGDTARMFEIPYPVSVTADLYGELKRLLGPNCVV
jgi:DNA polymerase-3 subunit alpha